MPSHTSSLLAAPMHRTLPAQIPHRSFTHRVAARAKVGVDESTIHDRGQDRRIHMRCHTSALMLCAALLNSRATASAQRQAHHSDFDGVWRMDTTKFEKRDALLAALTLTVSQQGDTLSIVTDVVDTGRAPIQMRSWYVPTAVATGSSSSTNPHATVGSLDWEGDTLVLRRTERRPDRTLEIEERWTLDPSGQMLSRYQRVRDGTRLSRQTLMFTRK